MAEWFERAAAVGKPRGLVWLGYDILGDVVMVETAGQVLALVPVLAHFAPEPDGELADVPQAHEPRPAVALFVRRGGVWETEGRTIFNLSPQQLIDRNPSRYRLLSEELPGSSSGGRAW